jgi:hypothetical protein
MEKLARASTDLDNLDPDEITDEQVLGIMDLIAGVIEAASTTEAADALRALPQVIMQRLMAAWMSYGDGDDPTDKQAGKERSQSSGGNRAARRSKPTARSGGSRSTNKTGGARKASSGRS